MSVDMIARGMAEKPRLSNLPQSSERLYYLGGVSAAGTSGRVTPRQVGDAAGQSLLTTRSLIVGSSFGTPNAAGGWRASNTGTQTMTNDTTFVRRPGFSTTKIDATASSGAYFRTFRLKTTVGVVAGPVVLWVYIPYNSAGGISLTVRWSSDAPGADPVTASPTNYYSANFTNDMQQRGFWTPLSMTPTGKLYSNTSPNGVATTTTGAPDATSIKQIEFDFSINTATPGAERYIYIDTVEINPKHRPMVVFGFDGGVDSSHTTYVLPEFDKWGMKGYFASDADSMAAGSVKLAAGYSRGWDVITQGVGHIDYAANSTTLAADIATSKAILNSYGWTRAQDIFAYPFNSHNATTDAILLANGYRAARATLFNKHVITSSGQSTLSPLGALDIGAKTAAQVQAWVDDAVTNGTSLILYGHTITVTSGASTETTLAEFQTMLSYLAGLQAAGTLDVVTPSEFLARVA